MMNVQEGGQAGCVDMMAGRAWSLCPSLRPGLLSSQTLSLWQPLRVDQVAQGSWKRLQAGFCRAC